MSLDARMNEKALYYVEMLLKAADVVNRRSSGTCDLINCRCSILLGLFGFRANL